MRDSILNTILRCPYYHLVAMNGSKIQGEVKSHKSLIGQILTEHFLFATLCAQSRKTTVKGGDRVPTFMDPACGCLLKPQECKRSSQMEVWLQLVKTEMMSGTYSINVNY